MDSSKPWYASTAVWGGILAALSPVIGSIFHVNVAAESSAIVDVLAAVGSAIGGAIAIYGRITATHKIGA